MLDNGFAKREFLDKWVNGLEEYRKSLEPFTMEYAAKTCQVPLETLHAVAKELAEARSIAILWAMGITQHHIGPIEHILGKLRVSFEEKKQFVREFAERVIHS